MRALGATMRFEVVSAPVEQRIASTIGAQTRLAAKTVEDVLIFTAEQALDVANKSSDPVLIDSLLCRSKALMSPTALPGALLLLLCVLHVATELAIHVLAKKSQKTN